MEILNPAGLLWLGALPLLLLPYLLRERPRRRVVSALFLYRGITPATRLRLGGRPKLEPLFFLQLLLLLVAVATLVRPAVKFTELRSSLVLDNSASLQARGGLGESRFEIAKRRAGETIAGDPAGIWDLFTLSPEPWSELLKSNPATVLTPGAARSRVFSRISPQAVFRRFTSSQTAAERRSHPSRSPRSESPQRISRSRASRGRPTGLRPRPRRLQ